MRKKQLRQLMIPLWGASVVYLILAQLATTHDPLHQWLHGNHEVAELCCHDETESSEGQHSPSEQSKDDSHSCFVSMLASGVLGTSISAVELPVAIFVETYVSWHQSPSIYRIASNKRARAPPLFASLS